MYRFYAYLQSLLRSVKFRAIVFEFFAQVQHKHDVAATYDLIFQHQHVFVPLLHQRLRPEHVQNQRRTLNGSARTNVQKTILFRARTARGIRTLNLNSLVDAPVNERNARVLDPEQRATQPYFAY